MRCSTLTCTFALLIFLTTDKTVQEQTPGRWMTLVQCFHLAYITTFSGPRCIFELRTNYNSYLPAPRTLWHTAEKQNYTGRFQFFCGMQVFKNCSSWFFTTEEHARMFCYKSQQMEQSNSRYIFAYFLCKWHLTHTCLNTVCAMYGRFSDTDEFLNS